MRRALRPVLYVVHTITQDNLLGNKEEYVVRRIRKPLIGVPYACKRVGSFQEGARLCRAMGFRPVFLEERHFRDANGAFVFGEPVEVKPEIREGRGASHDGDHKGRTLPNA